MSTTPRSKKTKKSSTRTESEQRRDNSPTQIKPALWKELRDKLQAKYQQEGQLNIATIEIDWYNLCQERKIRHEEPPRDQTLRNFLKEECKKREYWFIDGLCQLLLNCSFEEWEEQHKQTQEVSQEKSPYEDELRKQQAEIAEIKLLNSQSQLLRCKTQQDEVKQSTAIAVMTSLLAIAALLRNFKDQER